MVSNIVSESRLIFLPPVNYLGKESSEEGLQLQEYPTLLKFCSTLIREGVHEIIIPEFYKFELDSIPVTLRSRIRVVDRSKRVLNKVGQFFQPIIDDISIDIDNEELPLHEAFNALYTLALASKEQAFSSERLPTPEEFSKLREYVKNDEAIARIDILEGLTKIYSPTSADILEPIPTAISVSQRLQELLEDAEIYSLQKSRYLLGIHNKFKKGLIQTKRYVHRIAQNSSYKGIVHAGKESINLIQNDTFLPIKISNLLEFDSKKYNPPIVDIFPIWEKSLPSKAFALYLLPLSIYYDDEK